MLWDTIRRQQSEKRTAEVTFGKSQYGKAVMAACAAQKLLLYFSNESAKELVLWSRHSSDADLYQFNIPPAFKAVPTMGWANFFKSPDHIVQSAPMSESQFIGALTKCTKVPVGTMLEISSNVSHYLQSKVCAYEMVALFSSPGVLHERMLVVTHRGVNEAIVAVYRMMEG